MRYLMLFDISRIFSRGFFFVLHFYKQKNNSKPDYNFVSQATSFVCREDNRTITVLKGRLVTCQGTKNKKKPPKTFNIFYWSFLLKLSHPFSYFVAWKCRITLELGAWQFCVCTLLMGYLSLKLNVFVFCFVLFKKLCKTHSIIFI